MNTMTRWKIVFYVMGVLPWGFIVSLLSFYIRAKEILGYAPRYNQPDPGNLDIYSHYAPYIDFTMGIWLYSFIAWILLTIVYLIAQRKQLQLMPVIVSLFGQICAVMLVVSGIFEWYVD